MSGFPAVRLDGMTHGEGALLAEALRLAAPEALRGQDAGGGVLLAGGVDDGARLEWLQARAAESGRRLVLYDPSLADPALLAPGAVAGVVVTRAAALRRLNSTAPWLRWLRLAAPLDERALSSAARLHRQHRAALQSHLRLPAGGHWVLGPGPDTDPAGWRLLARVALRAVDLPWRLILTPAAGAPAQEVASLLRALPAERLRVWPAPADSDLLALLVCCDVCLWPGDEAGDVAWLVAAQAAGLPVVAGDGEVARECVRDGVTGRLLAAGNVEALANTLRFLLRHDAHRRSMARQAQDVVLGEHGLAPTGRALADFLRACAASG